MNKENYSEDKCYIKTNEWIVYSQEVELDEITLIKSSCKNVGCHRGLVRKGNQIYPSCACLLGLIVSLGRHKENEIVIKPNPKYL